MAIDRYLSGFESGDQGYILAASGAVVSTYRDVVNDPTKAVTGNYYLKIQNGTTSGRVFFPSGNVLGTSGTVSSGNHKRARLRCSFRIPTGGLSWTFSNQLAKLIGFGADNSYLDIVNNTATLANVGIGLWLRGSDNKLGIFLPNTAAGAGTVLQSVFTTVPALDTWYQLIFDVDFNVGASDTTVTVSATIINTALSINETITYSHAMGTATDLLGQISLAGQTSGAFCPAIITWFDDVSCIAASNADAVSQLALPANSTITAVPINGFSGVNDFETGNYTDCDEIPVNTGGGDDTLSSVKAAGAQTNFTHVAGGSLNIATVDWARVYVNARVGSGTGSYDIKINGSVVSTRTAGNTYPASGSGQNPTSDVLVANWDLAAFDSATLGIVKQNALAASLAIGNIFMEVMGLTGPFQPIITSISPSIGSTLGGDTVTISGSFSGAIAALFGQYGSKTISNDDTTIVVETPAHPAGAVDVAVATPVSGSPTLITTLANGFTFIAPAIGTITLDAARRDPEISVTNQLGNGQNSFRFSVNGEDASDFVAGKTIDMQLGTGETISKGVILQTLRVVEDSRFNERVDCTGNDNVWVVNAKLVKGTWAITSATTVAKAIINTFAPDFSSAKVESGLPTISLAFFLDANVGQALDQICALLPDGHWYLDTDNVIHLFNGVESGIVNPADLTDTNPDLLLAEYPIQVKTDISQMRNRVYVRGSGTPTSTGYQSPVQSFQGDPGGADPWVSAGGGWGSLLETGGHIDTDRNTPGLTWYWLASYIYVWTTISGDSLGDWTSRFPSPQPIIHPSGYTTGSNQIGTTIGLSYSNYDTRITGLKIYRELQRYGPHALNAAFYGNMDLYTPNQDSGHGPFFLVTTIPVASLPKGSPLHYLDVASEDTLVGGEMKKYSQLVGTDHSANIFSMVEDTAAQATLAALLGYGDGVREFLITDTSITSEGAAQARAQAELDLWANPILELTYATLDADTKVGATVHVNLTNPAITGDFKIQQVTLHHVHENDQEPPWIVATASSVRFTLNDLFARVILDNGAGSGSSLAAQAPADGSPSGAAKTALQLVPGKKINNVLFDATADIAVTASPDHANETPTGAVNGVNTVYTTAATYKAGSLVVFVNGIKQTKTTHWTETTTTTFTMNQAPITGDVVTVSYESN